MHANTLIISDIKISNLLLCYAADFQPLTHKQQYSSDIQQIT
jgi:hypothetical protein